MTVFSYAYGQKNTQLDESWAKWITLLSMPKSHSGQMFTTKGEM